MRGGAIAASLLAACGAASSAAPAPAANPAKGDLAPHTAESGADLGPIRQAMVLPQLALALDVDPQAQAIRGLAEYTVMSASALEAVEFDLDPRFAISEVKVDGEIIAPGSWSNDGGLLRIALPSPLEPGKAAMVGITYAGKPRVAPNPPWDGGFVWKETPGGQPWIATAVQPEGCDLFWPCLDHPSKRVGVVDLAIRVPEGLVAAANGQLIGAETVRGWTTWRWQARKPNGYGVSLQIAPYEVAQADYPSRYGNVIPIRFWHLPGKAEQAGRLVGELADYLDFFESTIGPYPFGGEKVGVAETPHLGMEHQTINAYGEGYKLAPEGYDWLMHHEFSHEWFANQLSMAATADMWLQEGLGTYMQPLYLRWKSGDAAYHAAMWDLRKKIKSKVPLAPRGFVSSSYYDDAQAGWGGDIYYKGAWVAHTLRHLIGDEAFFTSVRRLTYGRSDPAPGNFDVIVASTDDFHRLAEEESGRELDWFFEAYFRTAELPRMVSHRTGRTLELRWESPSLLPFEMPLEVQIGERLTMVPMPGGRSSIALPAADTHVILDPHARILRHDPSIAAWQAQQAQQAQAN